jgi:hypothetical protein
MYRVFSDEEIKLWRDWTLGLKRGKTHGHEAAASSQAGEHHFAQLRDAGHLSAFQAVSEQRLHHWLRLAPAESAVAGAIGAGAGAALAHAAATQSVSALNERFQPWLSWSMVRVVVHLARHEFHSAAAIGSTIESIQVGRGERHTIAEWFNMVQESPNPAAVANSFMAALANEIAEKTPTGVEFQDLIKRPATILGHACEEVVPGNDGFRAVDTIQAWIDAGCPLPRVRAGRARPLSLESTFDEEEHHPLGVPIGYGRIS